VRVAAQSGDAIEATANFIVHRFRRGDDTRIFVGQYRYKLRRVGGELKIAERRVILDAEELGMLGAVSFIL
jgi:p-cumate 2,3-dioxygenase beta subunit